MRKYFEQNYTFDELYSKLTKCSNIDIAYELYSPYSFREIANAYNDFKQYVIFVEDGILVINFENNADAKIIQVYAFDYRGWTIITKNTLYDELSTYDGDIIAYLNGRWQR